MVKTSRTLATAILLGLVCSLIIAAPSQAGTARLTAAERSQLQYLVEEEKLARDVYNFLAANVTTRKFSNIAAAEQTHMDLVSGLLAAYGVANPTTGKAPGVFVNPSLGTLYRTLTTSGALSYANAMQAGITIETMDIKDLQSDISTTSRTDFLYVMKALLRGSQNHLAAFRR